MNNMHTNEKKNPPALENDNELFKVKECLCLVCCKIEEKKM